MCPTIIYRWSSLLIVLLAVGPGTSLTAQQSDVRVESPYGVCAHLTRGDEHETAPKELKRMRNAGIRWVRADFNWSGIQPSKGKWQFDHLDRVVKWAEQSGVQILPILDYSADWADPAHEHLDAWTKYVRTVVKRYKDQIRVWEVWNEPNIDKFWSDPDAGDYLKLLRATYRTIKDVDPELTVVLSGMAGIPMSYLRSLYEQGAAEVFDVMNVHPYRYPRSPGAAPKPMNEEVAELRELMAEYGDADKPIWITELGWPTHQPPINARKGLYAQVFRTGLEKLLPNAPQGDLGIVRARGLPSLADTLGTTVERLVPDGMGIRNLTLDQLGSVDPNQVPVLLLPEGEGFPARARSNLVEYVKQGGIYLLPADGIPFFRALTRDENGNWSGERDDTLEKQLHLGWDAHWTGENTPEQAAHLTTLPASNDQIELNEHLPPGKRFLTRRRLEGNDQMTSLVRASNGSYSGSVAAVFDYDSELTGGGVILTLHGNEMPRGVTESRQAKLVVRSLLLALHSGVERFFWYEFVSPEQDPHDKKSYFGLLHNDLSPKPGYRAYHTLTRVRPAGSRPMGSRSSPMGLHHVRWKRPDGRFGHALWQRGARRQLRLRVDGSVNHVVDYRGNNIPVNQSGNVLEFTVGPGPVFLIGNGSIDVVK